MRRIPGYPLWLGHVGDARDLRAIFAAEIVSLLDLAGDEPPLAAPRGLVYVRFPLVDGDGNPPWLLRLAIATLADLLRTGVQTLAFCGAGLSRSVTIAAAALGVVRGEPMPRVLERLAPADVSPALEVSVFRALHPDALNDIDFVPADPRQA